MDYNFTNTTYNMLDQSAFTFSSIDYSEHGANWEGICASGLMQSPLDLPDWNIATFAPINADLFPIIHFGKVSGAYLDTSTNWVQVRYINFDGFLNLNGTFRNGTFLSHEYQPDGLLQFHTPSEHTIDGRPYAAELQIPFTDYSTGAKAIVSVFFDLTEKDSDNLFINALNLNNSNGFIDNLPLQNLIEDQIDAKVWYYEGSLTYPPCSENVIWLLL